MLWLDAYKLAVRSQQAAFSRQQAAGSRQQSSGSRQQSSGSRRQAGSRRAGSRQQLVRYTREWCVDAVPAGVTVGLTYVCGTRQNRDEVDCDTTRFSRGLGGALYRLRTICRCAGGAYVAAIETL